MNRKSIFKYQILPLIHPIVQQRSLHAQNFISFNNFACTKPVNLNLIITQIVYHIPYANNPLMTIINTDNINSFFILKIINRRQSIIKNHKKNIL